MVTRAAAVIIIINRSFPMAVATFIVTAGDGNGRGYLRASEGFKGLEEGLEGLRRRKGTLVDSLSIPSRI